MVSSIAAVTKATSHPFNSFQSVLAGCRLLYCFKSHRKYATNGMLCVTKLQRQNIIVISITTTVSVWHPKKLRIEFSCTFYAQLSHSSTLNQVAAEKQIDLNGRCCSPKLNWSCNEGCGKQSDVVMEKGTSILDDPINPFCTVVLPLCPTLDYPTPLVSGGKSY